MKPTGAPSAVTLTVLPLPSPKEIQRLEERLCSRFEWGLVADIQRPDVDTRLAILRDKVQQEGMNIPDDVLSLIAVKIDSNVRELEGCLTRLAAYSRVVGKPVTTELCEQALKEIFDQRRHKQVTAELIMQTVSEYYGVTLNDQGVWSDALAEYDAAEALLEKLSEVGYRNYGK